MGLRLAHATMRDQMAAFLREHERALNAHDVAALTEFYTDDALVSSPLSDALRGRADIADAFKRQFVLWPDYHIDVSRMFCLPEERQAVTLGSVSATHRNDLFGLAPTGEPIQYDSVRIYTFKGSLIAAEQRIYNLRGILEGLRKARLERELGMAAAIQRLLLARTHHQNAYVDVAGASIPSRTVGGDFLECSERASGELAVALGDASGKGPGAALVAAMVQGIVLAENDAARRPSDTLARINRALYSRQLERHFVTMLCGVLSTDGRFTYANAGHNAPVMMTRGTSLRLAAGGPPLGLFPDVPFTEETIALSPGDTIVAFTDGVADAENESGDEFSDARILTCLEQHRTSTAQETLDGLFKSVWTFGGQAKQHDDMTAVVIRRR